MKGVWGVGLTPAPSALPGSRALLSQPACLRSISRSLILLLVSITLQFPALLCAPGRPCLGLEPRAFLSRRLQPPRRRYRAGRRTQPRGLSLAGRRPNGRKPGSGAPGLRAHAPGPRLPSPSSALMAAAIMAAEQEAAKGGGGRNRGGVQRVEGKLRASVEKGDYYEAHQMYRTLFFRYGRAGPAAPPLPRPAFQSLPTHSPPLPPSAPTAAPYWSPLLSVSAPRSPIGPPGGGAGWGGRAARGPAGPGSGGIRLGPARPRPRPRPRRLSQRSGRRGSRCPPASGGQPRPRPGPCPSRPGTVR